MRPSLTALLPLLLGALVTGAPLLATGSGCGSFGEADPLATDGGSGAEGGVAVEPRRARNVIVAPSWPSVAKLDPSMDLRLASIVVTVTDAGDPSPPVERTFLATDKRPYALGEILTSSLVDVTVELREGSGRVLGYGERRRWNLATSDTVPVATRKRLLYFTSGDRPNNVSPPTGELRMFELAPAGIGEPGMAEPADSALPSLAAPTALYVTTDGLLLVQAGQVGSDKGPGQLAVFETGTHAPPKTIPTKCPLSAAVPLGDGHRLLGAPVCSPATTSFTTVDIDTAEVKDLPTTLQGGAISVSSIAKSPDGARVVAVGSYSSGTKDSPYVFTYDVGAPTVTGTDLSALVDSARAVRFMPDGKTFIVAGSKAAVKWSTGALLLFTATSGALTPPTKRIDLEAEVSRSSSLIIDPAGKYAYVGNQLWQNGADSCCGDLRVIDLATDKQVAVFPSGLKGPEFELASAIRLPYGPRRLIAGQSDNGNNVHEAVVELLHNTLVPADVSLTKLGDIGSIDALATPFGTPF